MQRVLLVGLDYTPTVDVEQHLRLSLQQQFPDHVIRIIPGMSYCAQINVSEVTDAETMMNWNAGANSSTPTPEQHFAAQSAIHDD